MKPTSLNALLSAVMLASGLTASAVIAKRGVMDVPQPDGSRIKVELKGDESHHYYTSEDGYLLVEDNGIFCYGKLSPVTGKVESTGLRAVNQNQRSATDRATLATIDKAATVKAYTSEIATKAQMRVSSRPEKLRAARAAAAQNAPEEGYPKGPGLFPGTAFPSIGEQKGIVVLVEYTDVKFTLSDPHAYFSRWLNETGFSDNGGTGCAREWFESNSNGLFKPEFDLYGPITLAHNMSYYGANKWSGSDSNPEMMVIEACQQLDATVDFSEYDRDGDGYVDNVYIIYAGRGEASGGGANTVWPHSWEITEATSTPYYFDGVRIDHYACSNEWEGTGTSGKPDGIGTFCHEFSHVMGLPDLYDTAYSTSTFTPGGWSALDYGPYNNDGCTPPAYGAFERYALGWMEPTEITGPMNGRLEHIQDSNDAYIIKTSKNTEFFLLENRQQKGWDLDVPGHGMLVWHIDYNSSVWTNNRVNNTASHPYVDIEEADNLKTEATRAGDAFPGTANITSFTDDTTPSMRTWSNVALGFPITDIQETDGVITFKAVGGLTDIPTTVINPVAEDLTSTSFTASWEAVNGATGYVLTLAGPDGEDLSRYKSLKVNNTTSYTFEGLTSETSYTLTVVVNVNGSFSLASEPVTFTTLAPSFADLHVALAEPTNVTYKSFTANWQELAGSTEYRLSVYEKYVDNHRKDVCDFTGGISQMSDGWSTDSNATYGNAAYSGEATPAVKLSTNGSYVQSPLYADDIVSVSFWHRGATSAASNSLSLMGLVNDEWIELGHYDIVNAKDGAIYSVDEVPAGTRRIKVVYNRVGNGYVSIDDVTVFHGGDVHMVPTGEYTDFNVGATLSYTATGLKPETTYYFTVRGYNGELLSLPSEEGEITTLVKPDVPEDPDPIVIDLAEADFTTSFDTDDEAIQWQMPNRDLRTWERGNDPRLDASAMVSTAAANEEGEGWMISPMIVVPEGGAEMTWMFDVFEVPVDDVLTVKVSLNGGTAPEDFTETIDAYKYEEIENEDGDDPISVTPTWGEAKSRLPEGNIRVAFIHDLSKGEGSIYIDYVNIKATPKQPLVGDVNGDGIIDATDIAYMVDLMLGIEQEGVTVETCDLNNDEKVTASDLALLILMILGE